jgi:polyphosphate kinase 2
MSKNNSTSVTVDNEPVKTRDGAPGSPKDESRPIDDTAVALNGDAPGDAKSKPSKPADLATRGKGKPGKGKRRSKVKRLDKKFYEKELARLQLELVKMQYWIKETGQRVILLFEGRDAAGKGGITRRIIERLNPRGVRLVALGKASDVEQTQWYFQRYVEHLPAAGEIVVFDRSWYNRVGVERVMGFCSDQQYWEFLASCPDFERMLARAGILVLKYWLSVDDDEQERRFQDRIKDPMRRWKLSPMDLVSREKWVQFSKAKDIMFAHTDIPEARWYQVEADDKRSARLNSIRHLLSKIPYENAVPEPIKLAPRPPADEHYVRPPRELHIIVPDHYADHK